jgi:hypothetical protein
MPTIAGQKLWNRKHITLKAGETTAVPHGLRQVRRNIDPTFKQAVQIIPLPPLANWVGIELGAQPDDEYVYLVNNAGTGNDVEVDVLFWEPHTVVGPGDADDYIVPGPIPPPVPVDVCGANDCNIIAGTTRTRRTINRILRRVPTAMLARFAPLLAARSTSPLG